LAAVTACASLLTRSQIQHEQQQQQQLEQQLVLVQLLAWAAFLVRDTTDDCAAEYDRAAAAPVQRRSVGGCIRTTSYSRQAT
jgi:hypothetical protein